MDKKERELIEVLLKKYRDIKSTARIELISKCPEYSLPAIDYSKTGTGETNSIYSSVEKHIMKKAEKRTKLIDLIRARDIIYTAYVNLPLEKKRIVKYIYFEGKTSKETADKLGYSKPTIDNRKAEILSDLKKVGIMNAYEYCQDYIK